MLLRVGSAPTEFTGPLETRWGETVVSGFFAPVCSLFSDDDVSVGDEVRLNLSAGSRCVDRSCTKG